VAPRVIVLFAPTYPPSDLPQCQGIRKTAYATDVPNTDKRCRHRGRFEIGGRSYCTKHAGQIALRILIEE
jgi:hypothetical protein